MTVIRRLLIDRLRDASSRQFPVRIERDHEWQPDNIYGFIVGLSRRWVVVQELVDSVYIDGYEVSRLEDITAVEDDPESGYVERAVAILGRPQVVFHLADGATTAEVLRAAASHSTLISVHSEEVDPFALLVGRVTRLGERKFELQLIGPRGVWENEVSRWRYKEVTRVEFGDRYTSQLERFGEGYAGT